MGQQATTGGAPVPRIRDFQFQSFFDSAKLQGALLVQSGSIIDEKVEQVAGVAAYLHPSSQTPIAIDFSQVGGGHASGPIIIKPGQYIRPGRFNSFRWGLPFGWLGGGLAQLLIAQNEETEFSSPGHAEVIFQRTRLAILASNAAGVVVTPNWPMRFPWLNAISAQTGGAAQGSTPVVGMVTPTKIMASLFNVAAIAGQGARVRFIFVNTDDFARNSTYVIPTAAIGNFPSYDVDFPAFAQSGITLANGVGTVENILQELDIPTPLARLGGDACSLILVDITPGYAAGAGPLVGQFLDVVRYGML